MVNEVFNEEMLLMGRVRSDEVITAEDLMLQKTIHEMDFADWPKWVQLVCDAPPASGDEVRRVRCNMLRSKMGGCGVAPRHSVTLRRTPRSVATMAFLQANFHFLHWGNVVERRSER